jgi:hypothetical protein
MKKRPAVGKKPVFLTYASGFTYAKDGIGSDDWFCRSMESCLMAGFYFRGVGVGDQYNGLF